MPSDFDRVIVRFLSKVELDDDDKCWRWKGALNQDRYGVLKAQKVNYYAHRFAHELFVGAIPPGHTVDHLCCVTSCVNPGHLEAVTIEENVARQWQRFYACRAAGEMAFAPSEPELSFMPPRYF